MTTNGDIKRALRDRKHAISTFRLQVNIPCRTKTQLNQHPQEGLIRQTLPRIPLPSQQLKELLLKFNSLNDSSGNKNNSGSMSQTRNVSKSGKINSFIAFRTFYCKSISNPEHQRTLSTELARIWKSEPSKHQWKLYAAHYNFRDNKNMPFVEWLCKQLNIQDNPKTEEKLLISIRSEYWSFDEVQIRNPVEDVYLTHSQV
uniref:MAT alpha 1 protein n=1 Tax=Suhomyces bribrorum TaxID=246069 RepID=A0A3Q9FFC6_9ASCO|nr:MAT alpha 1 protein [Suhomyces bribrorum]